jgi:heme-degrading monooxygenase HmoA
MGEAEAGVTVVSVLALSVRPSARAAFTQRFAELRVFELARQSGGFMSGRLLIPVAEDANFLVVADWQSAEDYRAWLDNPIRAELTRELESMLLSEPVPATSSRRREVRGLCAR